MAQTIQRTVWKVVGTGAGVVAAVVVRKALTSTWKRARHTDPPTNPAAPGTSWPEAIAWSLAMGAGVAVARLLVQRGAAAGWQKATGKLPPGLEEVSA